MDQMDKMDPMDFSALLRPCGPSGPLSPLKTLFLCICQQVQFQSYSIPAFCFYIFLPISITNRLRSPHSPTKYRKKAIFFSKFPKFLLDNTASRCILYDIGSGYSAAWSSAFDWGSKGPEFESPYPDHFFCSLQSSPLWLDFFMP